jgi:hypothetical protein
MINVMIKIKDKLYLAGRERKLIVINLNDDSVESIISIFDIPISIAYLDENSLLISTINSSLLKIDNLINSDDSP